MCGCDASHDDDTDDDTDDDLAEFPNDDSDNFYFNDPFSKFSVIIRPSCTSNFEFSG